MANDLALVHAHLWRLLTKVKFFLIFFPDQCISLIPGKFVKLPFKYFMFLMACLYRMTVASSSMVIFEVFFFVFFFQSVIFEVPMTSFGTFTRCPSTKNYNGEDMI